MLCAGYGPGLQQLQQHPPPPPGALSGGGDGAAAAQHEGETQLPPSPLADTLPPTLSGEEHAAQEAQPPSHGQETE